VSYLALACGECEYEHLVGDYGLLHEYAHLHQFRSVVPPFKLSTFTAFLERVVDVERRIPGYAYWDSTPACLVGV
jgi:hypothetical protein